MCFQACDLLKESFLVGSGSLAWVDWFQGAGVFIIPDSQGGMGSQQVRMADRSVSQSLCQHVPLWPGSHLLLAVFLVFSRSWPPCLCSWGLHPLPLKHLRAATTASLVGTPRHPCPLYVSCLRSRCSPPARLMHMEEDCPPHVPPDRPPDLRTRSAGPFLGVVAGDSDPPSPATCAVDHMDPVTGP